MRADGWSVGIVLAGLITVSGTYACLRYALPNRAADPELLLYGLAGLGPYVFASYGSGAAPRRTWARLVANAGGLVVCLAGALWLWSAVDDAVTIRAMRDAGQAHGLPGAVLLVLFLLPVQYGAGLVAAVVGGIAHDAYPGGE